MPRKKTAPGPLFVELYGFFPESPQFERARPWNESMFDPPTTNKPWASSACPFKGTYVKDPRRSFCTKDSWRDQQGRTHPTPTCVLRGQVGHSAVVCPHRLKVKEVFDGIGRAVFQPQAGDEVIPLTEVPLRAPNQSIAGNIDVVLAHARSGGIVDFCGLEVQAVYFSGAMIKKHAQSYLAARRMGQDGEMPQDYRQMDYRSSSKKRLLPQLLEKALIFHKWKRHFGVIVQDEYYARLPSFTENPSGRFHWFSYSLVPDTSLGRFGLEPRNHTTCEYETVVEDISRVELPDEGAFIADLQVRVDEQNS